MNINYSNIAYIASKYGLISKLAKHVSKDLWFEFSLLLHYPFFYSSFDNIIKHEIESKKE